MLVASCPGGNLHLVERHRRVIVAPVFAPALHERAHPLDENVVVAHVRAALIPDEALGGVALHRTLHGIVHPERIMVVVLADSFERLAELLEDFFGKPALHACTSVGESDYADGNIEHAVKLAGEEERGRAHPEYAPGVRLLPAAMLANVVQRLVGLVLGHGDTSVKIGASRTCTGLE